MATTLQPATPGQSIRVLTVNTHKGFGVFNRAFVLHELREAVRDVGADVVFLQEVQGEHSGHSDRTAAWPEEPHYEFLADRIWPEYAYGRNAVYPEGHHGNALLSKYPIVEWSNHDVSIGPREMRGLLHCVLSVAGRKTEVHAICVHLGLKDSQRRHQLELLCKLADKVPADAPLLVAGDFNDWQQRAHCILQDCAGLSEVFVHAHGHAAKTFPAAFPLLQLDRIYVRNALGHAPMKLPRQPWAGLSDHAPLGAEIWL
jgi:endonuclease/exonuclease/phosphatase family metal-dependent hydrolase